MGTVGQTAVYFVIAVAAGILVSEAIVRISRRWHGGGRVTNPEIEKAKDYCRCGNFHHGPAVQNGLVLRCAACGSTISAEQYAECLHVRQQALKIMAKALQGASTR